MPTDQQRLPDAQPSVDRRAGDKGLNYGWLPPKNFKGRSTRCRSIPPSRLEKLGYINFKSLDEVPGDIDLLIARYPGTWCRGSSPTR
jgi:hypothetical protein